MKKVILFFTAMFISSIICFAQEDQNHKVEIKAVTTENGVKKSIDTVIYFQHRDDMHEEIEETISKLLGKDVDHCHHKHRMVYKIDSAQIDKLKSVEFAELEEKLKHLIHEELEESVLSEEVIERLKTAEKEYLLKMKKIHEKDFDSLRHKSHTSNVEVIVIKHHFNIDVSDATEKEMKKIQDSDNNLTQDLALNSLEVYPNPSNGTFTIKAKLENNSPVEIELFDESGKKIFESIEEELNGGLSKEISLPEENAGMYFLRVNQEGKGVTKKVMVSN